MIVNNWKSIKKRLNYYLINAFTDAIHQLRPCTIVCSLHFESMANCCELVGLTWTVWCQFQKPFTLTKVVAVFFGFKSSNFDASVSAVLSQKFHLIQNSFLRWSVFYRVLHMAFCINSSFLWFIISKQRVITCFPIKIYILNKKYSKLTLRLCVESEIVYKTVTVEQSVK